MMMRTVIILIIINNTILIITTQPSSRAIFHPAPPHDHSDHQAVYSGQNLHPPHDQHPPPPHDHHHDHDHSDHQAVSSGRTFHPLQDPAHIFLLEALLLCQEGEKHHDSRRIYIEYILFLTSSSCPGSSIPTLSAWVSQYHFRTWTQRVTFDTWYSLDILSELCVDKRTKRSKDKKTKIPKN